RIGVTVVHPGGVNTNIVRASRTADPDAKARMIERFERSTVAPAVVAEQIARGVERGALRVRVCRETYAVDWAKRLFPSGVHRLVCVGYRCFVSLGYCRPAPREGATQAAGSLQPARLLERALAPQPRAQLEAGRDEQRVAPPRLHHEDRGAADGDGDQGD